jgi:tripartite-type tricarboxylate transporter receptor subunit TctC
MKSRLPHLLLVAACAASGMGLGATSPPAHADSYPDKPIRIVVPFAPGGFADIAGRKVAQVISPKLDVPVIVDNKAGAGGIIGADFVAKAPHDGYTLLLGSNGPVSVGPSLYPNVQYDPIKDFAPIINLGVSPITLVVNPAVPAHTLPEFIAYLKANPGKVTMGSPGVGTSSHLAGELFQIMTGTKMVHVPYKGSGPSMADLVAGQTMVAFDPLSSCLPLVQSGRLRALAVTTPQRAPSLPAVPTMDEAGVKGYEASTYVALLAPAGTPQAVIDKLNAVVGEGLRSEEVKASFAQFATVPLGGTPQQLSDYLKNDLAKWAKVIGQAHITAQ